MTESDTDDLAHITGVASFDLWMTSSAGTGAQPVLLLRKPARR